MTLEDRFVLACAVVGIAQVLDAFALRRADGMVEVGKPLFYFAMFEHAWAVVCLCLFDRLALPHKLLAAVFVLYIPLSWIVTLLARERPVLNGREVRVPMVGIHVGGGFGLAFFIGALVALCAT